MDNQMNKIIVILSVLLIFYNCVDVQAQQTSMEADGSSPEQTQDAGLSDRSHESEDQTLIRAYKKEFAFLVSEKEALQNRIKEFLSFTSHNKHQFSDGQYRSISRER